MGYQTTPGIFIREGLALEARRARSGGVPLNLFFTPTSPHGTSLFKLIKSLWFQYGVSLMWKRDIFHGRHFLRHTGNITANAHSDLRKLWTQNGGHLISTTTTLVLDIYLISSVPLISVEISPASTLCGGNLLNLQRFHDLVNLHSHCGDISAPVI